MCTLPTSHRAHPRNDKFIAPVTAHDHHTRSRSRSRPPVMHLHPHPFPSCKHDPLLGTEPVMLEGVVPQHLHALTLRIAMLRLLRLPYCTRPLQSQTRRTARRSLRRTAPAFFHIARTATQPFASHPVTPTPQIATLHVVSHDAQLPPYSPPRSSHLNTHEHERKRDMHMHAHETTTRSSFPDPRARSTLPYRHLRSPRRHGDTITHRRH